MGSYQRSRKRAALTTVLVLSMLPVGCSRRFGTGVDDVQLTIGLSQQTHEVHGLRIRGKLPKGYEALKPDWIQRTDLELRKTNDNKTVLVSVKLGIRRCRKCDDHGLLERARAGLRATIGIAALSSDQPGKINPVLEKARVVRPGIVTFSGWGLSTQDLGTRLRVTHVYLRLPVKGTYLRCVVRLYGGYGRQWKRMRDVCAALRAEPLEPGVRSMRLSTAWSSLRGESVPTRIRFCRTLDPLLPDPIRKACAKLEWRALEPTLALARKRIRKASLGLPELDCDTLPKLAGRLGDAKKQKQAAAICTDVVFGGYAKRAIEQASADLRTPRETLPTECLVANLERASGAATHYVKKLKAKIVDLCFGRLAPAVIKLGRLKGGQCKASVEEAYRGIVRYQVRTKAARRARMTIRWKCRTLVDRKITRKADWRAVK